MEGRRGTYSRETTTEATLSRTRGNKQYPSTEVVLYASIPLSLIKLSNA